MGEEGLDKVVVEVEFKCDDSVRNLPFRESPFYEITVIAKGYGKNSSVRIKEGDLWNTKFEYLICNIDGNPHRFSETVLKLDYVESACVRKVKK